MVNKLSGFPKFSLPIDQWELYHQYALPHYSVHVEKTVQKAISARKCDPFPPDLMIEWNGITSLLGGQYFAVGLIPLIFFHSAMFFVLSLKCINIKAKKLGLVVRSKYCNAWRNNPLGLFCHRLRCMPPTPPPGGYTREYP